MAEGVQFDHLKDRREKDIFFRDEMLPEDTQNVMD